MIRRILIDTDIKTLDGVSLLGGGNLVTGGGLSGLVISETPTGLLNGVNTIFNSLFNFKVESLEIYLNGLKLKKLEDYNTSGTTTMTLYASPGAVENIQINYQKLT